MKLSQLIAKMKENGVQLPSTGTGRGGKILARDLENALGDYFFNLKYPKENTRREHCLMRRSFEPMKAYRYSELSGTTQHYVLDEENFWCAEEKYNGWRIVITYIPESGFCFWGGNISDKDFLPVDYTDHVILEAGMNDHHNILMHLHRHRFAMDAEALCHDTVETLDGRWSNNTLEAIGAILGSNSSRARTMQKEGAAIQFKLFDYIRFEDRYPVGMKHNLETRQQLLDLIVGKTRKFVKSFSTSERVFKNKRRMLQKLWKEGKEGIVLKNTMEDYASGGRLKSHAIKVKRTMSGEIGDDLDCFISGFINTPEHAKKGLIGGIELSVYIDNGSSKELHHIATVTSLPDSIREAMTYTDDTSGIGRPTICPDFLLKVVVVDGQELSSKNRKLMHAKVDWNRGFRVDKSSKDCVIELKEIEEEKF